MTEGQTVAAHGLFDDGSNTGVGLFFVVRHATDAGCEVAPLGVENEYWRSHLELRHSCTAVYLKKVGQAIPASKEVFTKWKILAGPGVDFDLGEEFPWLGKVGVAAAKKQIAFLRAYVVADEAASSHKAPNRRGSRATKRKLDDRTEVLDDGDDLSGAGGDDAHMDAEQRMLKGISGKDAGRTVKPKLSEAGGLGSVPKVSSKTMVNRVQEDPGHGSKESQEFPALEEENEKRLTKF